MAALIKNIPSNSFGITGNRGYLFPLIGHCAAVTNIDPNCNLQGVLPTTGEDISILSENNPNVAGAGGVAFIGPLTQAQIDAAALELTIPCEILDAEVPSYIGKASISVTNEIDGGDGTVSVTCFGTANSYTIDLFGSTFVINSAETATRTDVQTGQWEINIFDGSNSYNYTVIVGYGVIGDINYVPSRIVNKDLKLDTTFDLLF